MKKNDLILVGVIIILVVITALINYYSGKQSIGEARVTAFSDGKIVYEGLLDEGKTISIQRVGGNGENLLMVADGYADIAEADCKDKLCVRQKKISRSGESIICLPNKLVVSITGGIEDATVLDAVVN